MSEVLCNKRVRGRVKSKVYKTMVLDHRCFTRPNKTPRTITGKKAGGNGNEDVEMELWGHTKPNKIRNEGDRNLEKDAREETEVVWACGEKGG